MKNLIFISIYAYFLLFLRQAAAVPSTVPPPSDVGIQSVNLVFKPGCNRHDEIQRAWDDAIKIVSTVRKIDYNSGSAFHYLGPPIWNRNYTSNIQAIFDNTKTFGQGWKIVPAPWKVAVNIDCNADPASTEEVDVRCKSNIGGKTRKAYTWNTEFPDGTGDQNYQHPNATMNLFLCNSFFEDLDLDDRVNAGKEIQDIFIKYDLRSYYNRAYTILHEMMHANRITYAANGDRPVHDLVMPVKTYVDYDEDGPEGTILMAVQGALNAKIFARTDCPDIAADITLNADNYALYALGKYVESKIVYFPYVPNANGQADRGCSTRHYLGSSLAAASEKIRYKEH
ncbi:hypothetical protein F5X68DRAFT_201409 [Plectosphaerella plurivora]|uniref:Uncharacterized protein n=1 Tax=Plectosphaerella plurivora TaxID=936078 RepID=A0A9P8VJJ1_9PEZI|nr:hypothetical protein F5X68DRAFT_201409 [Plectosphaerella plurivora]